MASNYDVKDNTYTHVGVPFNYTRGNPLPIDNSSVWTTLSDAQNYALSSPVSYVGQIITVNNGSGVSAYVIENTSGSLKALATGGDASALETKLNQEIADRGTADTYISGKVDTVSTDLDTLKTGAASLSGRVDTLESDRTTISTNLGTLSGSFVELKDTTLPLSVSNLKSSLSVTVEKLDTPSTSAYIATYVVRQGGAQVGSAIDIPRDFLVKNAEVKICVEKDKPIEGLNVGDKYLDFTINASGGEGGEKHIYVNLKDLTDIYTGAETDTVKVEVGSDNKISANVKTGSIDFVHITTNLSNYIKSIRTDVDQVSTDLGLSVTNLEGQINTARTDLSTYARETSAAALVDAKAYTDTSIGNLDKTISATVTTDNAQKVFTKITQTDGKLDTFEEVQLAVKDINGLSSALSQVETNAKTYTDNKLDALDWTNNIGSTQRVKSITQTDGAISVVAETMSLENIANAKNDLTVMLSDVYDAKGSAATAESNAKTYTDTLSTAVDTKLATEKSERETRDTNLSAYARETSAAALVDAKAYTDSKVAGLSVDVIKSELCAYSRETSAASFEASKTYTNGVSTDLSTDYVSKINALEATAATSAATAEANAKAYADGISTDLSTDYVSKINALEATAATSAATAEANAKAYVNGVSTDLSTDYVSKISTEKSRAEGVESEISTKLGNLSSSFQTVSADHENRISTVEGKVAKLSSSMHFKGVNLTAELSTGSKDIPIPPYKTGETPEAGDVIIVKDSKEFVWALSSDSSDSGMWYELGAEGVWATKSALQAEETRAKAAESTISGVVDTISADLYKLSGEVELSVGNLTGLIDAEATARSTADTALQTAINNKVTVDGKQADLSVVHLTQDEYHARVVAGTLISNEVYVVSSDFLNMYGEKIVNLGEPTLSSDAVTKNYVDTEISDVKSEIVANALSGVKLNGVDFTVANNIASLSIDYINCGSAE